MVLMLPQQHLMEVAEEAVDMMDGMVVEVAVVERIYAIVKNVQGHLRLPSIVYWYKIALGRYVSTHSYEESKDYLLFARKLAISFHDGPLNHLTVRFLPPGLLYLLLKAVHH